RVRMEVVDLVLRVVAVDGIVEVADPWIDLPVREHSRRSRDLVDEIPDGRRLRACQNLVREGLGDVLRRTRDPRTQGDGGEVRVAQNSHGHLALEEKPLNVLHEVEFVADVGDLVEERVPRRLLVAELVDTGSVSAGPIERIRR